MTKPIPTDAAYRVQDRILKHSPDEAIRELHDCLIAVNACMEVLAGMFPHATLLTGIDRGQPCSALAFATSTEAHHFTPAAMGNAQRLAKLVASVPDDLLQDAFRIELNCAAEIRRLRAEAARQR